MLHKSKLRFIFAVLILAACAAAPPAHGGVLSISSPPPSVLAGALENSANIWLFAERQNFSLHTALRVDITAPGTYNSLARLTPGTVPAGTLVNSFFLHFDPVGTNAAFATGSATFGTDILGVIVTFNNLNGSDAAIGSPATLYPSFSAARGVDFGDLTQGDNIILSADFRTLTLTLGADAVVDQLRVITAAAGPAAIPEPLSFLLLGSGLAGTAAATAARKQGGRTKIQNGDM